MQYMLLIQQSNAADEFDKLSEDEQKVIYGRVQGDQGDRRRNRRQPAPAP